MKSALIAVAAIAILAAHGQAWSQTPADLAGSLEEALGHFKALEDNLDDGNAELALVHATHPIAELYDSMKPQLVATDPALDARINQVLKDLGDRTGSGVTRAQAQSAIDDAKEVIESARTAVVGPALSQDHAFKIDLAKGLLETSIAEYGEAVEDGTITNMPEFQDGSAFVWRAEQITDTLGSGLSGAYDAVNAAYDRRADPAEVESATRDLMDMLDAVNQESIDFAGSLEEALGHFKALEDNLDDGNAELALVHATHPIAELYDSMKPQLVDTDPALDARINQVLQDLGDRTGSGVTRAQAQSAIDDAKKVIESARTAVVGDYLSQKTDTKLALMRGLLETSVAEYGEAVEDGTITNMPEFQDGSAFVWRAAQIMDEVRGDVDGAQAMTSAFSQLDSAYDRRVAPSEVASITERITSEIDSAIGSSETDLLEYVDNIRSLLEQARAEYSQGNRDVALSLATKAYLDNYEFLEAPLIELGERDLMEKVEDMLREDLRGMVRAGEPASAVSSQIDRLLSEMESIAELFEPAGSAAGSSETDLLEYVDNIRSLLGEASSAYSQGDRDVALSLATKAYLDNYEFLEDPLIELGERDLMEKVEDMLREDLLGMVRAGEPASAVSSQIGRLLSEMDGIARVVAPNSGVAAMADSATAADLAGSLEEALGHFKALEDNLDDGNAELALVHATHPIAELYDSMKPQLAAVDPSLDARIQETLDNLGDRTGSGVTRAQAQSAIDDAKKVIESARTAVVGPALSQDPAFKIDLAKGLLETSIAEYGEAVEDGTITNMPEFQDGSAFVWRAEQITGTLGADGLSGAYDAVNSAYERRADPAEVESATRDLMSMLDALNAERVDFAGALEEAIGHFKALEDNLDEGNAELALVHATHPVAELYDSIKPQLAASDSFLDGQVRQVLSDLGDRTGSDVTREQAQSAIDDARLVVEIARTVVVGEYLSQKTDTKLALMRGLLETSVAEYGEAVEAGTITNMPEFQDGSAFVWRAAQIMDEVRGDISGAQAMDSAFSQLESAYDRRVAPSEVASITGRITSEIDSSIGSSETDLLEYVDNIRSLLEQARAEYSQGNRDVALSLATKAYLDNYEFLEAPLIELGERELMERVEVMLREDLRSMIRDGEPAGDVGAQIDAILSEMDGIARVVPEFGVVAVLVMATAVAAAVGLTARSRLF